MEDFSSVTVDTENQEACFAVYDGHGGQDAASFCQRNLWHNIRFAWGIFTSNLVE